MIGFKMYINGNLIDNQYILDSIEFNIESGMNDYTVGQLLIPTAKIKLHNDVDITYDSVVKIFLVENDAEVAYGVYEPYEIKQGNLARDIVLYPQCYFLLQ